MNAAELLVKAFEHENIKYIFGVAGEENLHFMEALSKSKLIKYIPVRHEQSAGFMAATYGRLTGEVAVALSTLGPGATNLVTAAAYAKLGGMPMLMLTGQKPIDSYPQGYFQIIDIIGMMQPVTQFSKQIVNGNNIPVLVRNSIKIAENERPGPVHLELPKDIAQEQVEVVPFENQKVRRPIAEDKAIAQALELISSAKTPLLLIGAGANRKRTSKMLNEFIEKLKMPFFDTQMGKGVINEDHELFLGTAATSSNDFVHKAIEKSDLIINVGHDVIEKPPFNMHKTKAKVIHINFYPAEIEQVYHPHLEVIGDIANAIWQLKEKLPQQNNWDYSEVNKIKEQYRNHITEKSDADNFPLLPQRIVADVREAMPDSGIVALDNGMYKLWFTRYYPAREPNTLLVDNALATMGAGLPSGIAAKLVYPERKVLVIAGDGGFMMNSQELETAVRLNLDLVVLIINDNGLGMIKWEQEEKDFKDFGLSFGNPDFVKYAESYGAKGYRVEKTEDLQAYLDNALNSKGVHLIEVPVDYSENIKVFTEGIKQLTEKL